MPLQSDVLDLIALFNRQTSDLPDGLLHKDCVFRLNGRAYHEQLGRPAGDPLVRLVGCGAAGYRFILTALRYGMEEPRVTVHEGSIRHGTDAEGSHLDVRGSLTGTLRGRTGKCTAEFGMEVRADRGGHIREIAATMGDADVELLVRARQS